MAAPNDNETEEQTALEAPRAPLPPVPGIVIAWVRGTPRCEVHALGNRPLTIGRSSAADVQVDDNATSSKHVEIGFRAGRWTIEK